MAMSTSGAVIATQTHFPVGENRLSPKEKVGSSAAGISEHQPGSAHPVGAAGRHRSSRNWISGSAWRCVTLNRFAECRGAQLTQADETARWDENVRRSTT